MTTILLITNMYPPHHYGGYELSCRDVVDRLRARGHRVTVLTTTMRVEGVVERRDERAHGVLRDLEFYWDDHDLVRPSLRKRLEIERHNQAVLREALRQIRPDVVSVWHMAAMSFGLLTTVAETGIPLVYMVCDDWLIYGPRLDPWARLFLGRPRLGRVVGRLAGVPTVLPDLASTGAFCFVSAAVRRHAEMSTPWRFPESAVVYSGIEGDEFPPRPRSGEWRWRLLYVGRIDARKGIDTVIKALSLLPPQATLEIVGRGDRRVLAELQQLVTNEALQDRVSFVGAVERAGLHRHYQAADVVVFPPVWDEPFGLVPLEAMACGTPVAATCTGGSTEYLASNVNCLCFPAGDASALAGAVERLAHEPDLRARLVESGFRTAEALDVDGLAEVLEAWHVGAAEQFRSGRPARRLLALPAAP